MKTLRRLALVSLVGAYLCASQGWLPAWAAPVFQRNNSGTIIQWSLTDFSDTFGGGIGTISVDGLPAKWYFNVNGTADVAGTAEFPALKKGMQPWMEVANSQFMAVYAGTTTESQIRVNAGTNQNPINVVFFQSGFDPNNPNTLAYSDSSFYSSGSPNIISNDILFYDGWDWSASGEAAKYDIQSVMTHEYGHSIGFDHSSYNGRPNVNGGNQYLDGVINSNGTTLSSASFGFTGKLTAGDFVSVLGGSPLTFQYTQVTAVNSNTLITISAVNSAFFNATGVEFVGFDTDTIQTATNEDTMDTSNSAGQTSQQTLASNDMLAVQQNYPSSGAQNIPGIFMTSVMNFDEVIAGSTYAITYRYQDDNGPTITATFYACTSNTGGQTTNSSNLIGTQTLSNSSGATSTLTGTFNWDGTGGGTTPGTSYYIVAKITDGTNIRYDYSAGTVKARSKWWKSDFNGDKKDDILFRHSSSGDVYLWIMN